MGKDKILKIQKIERKEDRKMEFLNEFLREFYETDNGNLLERFFKEKDKFAKIEILKEIKKNEKLILKMKGVISNVG